MKNSLDKINLAIKGDEIIEIDIFDYTSPTQEFNNNCFGVFEMWNKMVNLNNEGFDHKVILS